MTMTPRPFGDTNAEPQPVEGLERIQPLLARWTGGMATLWTYSVSHSKLVLRLARPTVRGNLHLICYDCRRYSGPTVWGGINVQVAAEDTPEGRRYVIRDDANKVEIRCGVLTAMENVEPVY
jgi:hypothetical protein